MKLSFEAAVPRQLSSSSSSSCNVMRQQSGGLSGWCNFARKKEGGGEEGLGNGEPRSRRCFRDNSMRGFANVLCETLTRNAR